MWAVQALKIMCNFTERYMHVCHCHIAVLYVVHTNFTSTPKFQLSHFGASMACCIVLPLSFMLCVCGGGGWGGASIGACDMGKAMMCVVM